MTSESSAPPGTRRLRLLAGLLGAAALVVMAAVVLAVVGERRAVRAALPLVDGRIAVSGLSRTISIVRDARGVPHVRARRRRDAYFGLGFVHAQDRLAQMTWLLRTARGRRAEILGPEALPADRLVRTLGLARLAEREAERLDAQTRSILEAYAAGVNARLARIRAGRVAAPRELARLEVPLEDWTVADSLAVAKLYAWGLDGSLDVSLVLDDLVRSLGGFEARPFFPSGAASALVPLPGRRPVQARGRAPDGVHALRRAVGMSGRSVGSSAWIVSGRHSVSGRPLLAGDVHLEATTPPLFYQAHLHTGSLDLVGAGPPGLPIFWSGHNGHVAWASTSARAVVVDLYDESVDPNDPSRYRVESRWRSMQVRDEEIRVRGGPSYTLRVRETRHGPLVEEIVADDRGPLSVAWAGAREGDGISPFLEASQARDAEAFRASLASHLTPVLAVVYADSENAGGVQVAGWIPRRAMATSLVPVPGRTRWYDWRGRIPFEELPHVTLEEGVDWLIAADNPLGDSEPPYTIEWLWRTGERARRIDSMLRRAVSQAKIDTQRLARLQRDVKAPGSPKRARLALELAGPSAELPREAAEIARTLRLWDGETAVESSGAAAYNVFLTHLLGDLLAERVGQGLLERYARLPGAGVEALVGHLLDEAFDPRGATAGLVDPLEVRAAVHRSLRRAGLDLLVRMGTNRSKWSWGRLHRLRFRPFAWPSVAGGSSLLRRTPGIDFAIPFGGDRMTVSVGEYDLAEPFATRVVSLYRIAIDLDDPHVALSSLAPGPSEHRGHPHRHSELDAWLEGEPRLLVSQPLLVDETARARLRLDPLSGS